MRASAHLGVVRGPRHHEREGCARAHGVLGAAPTPEADGVTCACICLHSAELVSRASEARRITDEWRADVLERRFPARRAAPTVTVVDGHSRTLAILGAVNSRAVACLGVSDLGHVGEVGAKDGLSIGPAPGG